MGWNVQTAFQFRKHPRPLGPFPLAAFAVEEQLSTELTTSTAAIFGQRFGGNNALLSSTPEQIYNWFEMAECLWRGVIDEDP